MEINEIKNEITKKIEINNMWETPTEENLNNILKLNNIKYYEIIGSDTDIAKKIYSFVRCFNQKGDYLFALPFLIGLEEDAYKRKEITTFLSKYVEIKKELISKYITKHSSDPNKSNNGGEYDEGIGLFYNPKIGYEIKKNTCLNSDFQEEFWVTIYDCKGKTEAIKYIGKLLGKVNLPN